MSARLARYRSIVVRGAILAVALGATTARAAAQRVGPRLLFGGGAVSAQSGQLPTHAGVALTTALELPLRLSLPHTVLSARAEGGWTSQQLMHATSGGLRGDIQTARAGLLLRAAPSWGTQGAPGWLSPYAVAGLLLSRSSMHVSIADNGSEIPGASFEQTSSDVAIGGSGGVGAGLTRGVLDVFVETRLDFAHRAGGGGRATFVIAGFALPLGH